jgi:hypothetical protein
VIDGYIMDEAYDPFYMDHGYEDMPFFQREWGDFPGFDEFGSCLTCGTTMDEVIDGLCSMCWIELDEPDKHSLRREEKRQRAINGMQMSGRSTKSVILPVIEKRADEARRKERHNAR